ncbi:MAG: hypothetical protein AMXMBFR58_20620 [Phycisphaerae bacterium]|nr:hypothetical protein [Phycisphaerales bacterium]MCK6475878.1 hypothetical protein [Phycisphaerales bacterium]
MLVYLDDVPVPVSGDSVSAALEAVGVAAQQRGRIVVEVLLNGRPAGADVLAGRIDAAGSEFRCRSADPAQVVADTLGDAAAELSGLISDQKLACEKLWAGGTGEAVDSLKDVLERWRLVQEALNQCLQATGLGLGEISIESGKTGTDLSALLARLLEQIRTELGAGRFVELADLLGVDLSNLAEQWRDLLMRLRRAVLDSSGSASS